LSNVTNQTKKKIGSKFLRKSNGEKKNNITGYHETNVKRRAFINSLLANVSKCAKSQLKTTGIEQHGLRFHRRSHFEENGILTIKPQRRFG